MLWSGTVKPEQLEIDGRRATGGGGYNIILYVFQRTSHFLHITPGSIRSSHQRSVVTVLTFKVMWTKL